MLRNAVRLLLRDPCVNDMYIYIYMHSMSQASRLGILLHWKVQFILSTAIREGMNQKERGKGRCLMN